MSLVSRSFMISQMQRLERKFWKLYDSNNNLVSEMMDPAISLSQSEDILNEALSGFIGGFATVKLFLDNSIDGDKKSPKLGASNQHTVMTYKIQIAATPQTVNTSINAAPVKVGFDQHYIDLLTRTKELEAELMITKFRHEMDTKFDKMKLEHADDGTTDILKMIASKIMTDSSAPGTAAMPAAAPVAENMDLPPNSIGPKLKESLTQLTNIIGFEGINKLAAFATKDPENARNMLNMI